VEEDKGYLKLQIKGEISTEVDKSVIKVCSLNGSRNLTCGAGREECFGRIARQTKELSFQDRNMF
jgi:hypothetical protein